MENTPNNVEKPLKLNYKRVFLIGFAFFGILLLWQVYDSWCPTFLSEAFKKVMCTQLFGPTLSISYQRVDGMERA